MGPERQIKRDSFLLKTCTKCGGSYGIEGFTKTKSLFYKDGYLPICNGCIKEIIKEQTWNWNIVDKICQFADIPFIPKEWNKVFMNSGEDSFPVYAQMFMSKEYDGIGWGEYYRKFKALEEQQRIDKEIPLFNEEKIRKLQKKWGSNYDEEELDYLEGLYNGLLLTQNVTGALQHDQALKLCKISLEIESRIRSGCEFDKILASYEKMVKVGEFTPKNAKNANNFDSVGELITWLEKKGWKCKYYDNVTRDIVDETIKNMQNYNQRLYTNETGIGDEITKRLQALKTAKEMENYYDSNKEYDLDEFDNDGYNELFKNEEFEVTLEGEDDE